MSTYLVPRKSDNQNRILYFFTFKGFIYLSVGMLVGLVISLIVGIFVDSLIAKIIIIAIFGIIGVGIGELKIPETKAMPLFRNTGGEAIDDIILRSMKFSSSKKIYIYGKKE